MFRIRNALTNFMRGRYAQYDGLNKFLLVIWIICAFLNIFLRTWILSALGLVFAILPLLRMLSKNLPARAKEEMKYQQIKKRISDKIKLLKNRWRDRKTHVYISCPFCKNTLRLPKKKGKHGVICPCCKKDFNVKI